MQNVNIFVVKQSDSNYQRIYKSSTEYRLIFTVKNADNQSYLNVIELISQTLDSHILIFMFVAQRIRKNCLFNAHQVKTIF